MPLLTGLRYGACLHVKVDVARGNRRSSVESDY
jgi:hypothetical protein